MARSPESSLDRLRRQVWIRALRYDYNRKMAEDTSLSPSAQALVSWAEFGRMLLQQNAECENTITWRFQGLLGIINNGNDPRRTILRIPVKELAQDLPQNARIVNRRPSGRPATGEKNSDSISYIEIPIDLVYCGEALCPGSDQWLNAYLWELTKSNLPKLEDLRVIISHLKKILGVCTMPAKMQKKFQIMQIDDTKNNPHEMLIERYRNSLKPFAELPTANSLSLLAALTTESYITGHEILLELHQESFYQGCKRYFENPEFSDIKDTIDRVLIQKIVLQEWDEPFAYHTSSLNSPFITESSSINLSLL